MLHVLFALLSPLGAPAKLLDA
jgi:putative PIN family toxin of toxin-antitoxin system